MKIKDEFSEIYNLLNSEEIEDKRKAVALLYLKYSEAFARQLYSKYYRSDLVFTHNNKNYVPLIKESINKAFLEILAKKLKPKSQYAIYVWLKKIVISKVHQELKKHYRKNEKVLDDGENIDIPTNENEIDLTTKMLYEDLARLKREKYITGQMQDKIKEIENKLKKLENKSKKTFIIKEPPSIEKHTCINQQIEKFKNKYPEQYEIIEKNRLLNIKQQEIADEYNKSLSNIKKICVVFIKKLQEYLSPCLENS